MAAATVEERRGKQIWGRRGRRMGRVRICSVVGGDDGSRCAARVKGEEGDGSGVGGEGEGPRSRIDEEGEGGGEESRRCSGRGGAPALSRRGRGAALKGESEGVGAVYCVRERVFGGAAAGGLGFGFFCACACFFLCVFKEPTE